MKKQKYEDYWKLTVEYTDINDDKFIGTLRIIVDFINENNMVQYSSDLYKALQKIVYEKYPKSDMGSVRKSINQFIKLGFISYQLGSYSDFANEFLEAKTNRKRKSVFSKAVYSNSSFNSSVTEHSPQKEINFLLKTLEEVGKLHKKDIVGLMTIDIPSISTGFLNTEEVKKAREDAEKNKFIERKYNQVGYLWNFLRKLDDLVIINDELYFEEDVEIEKIKLVTRKRDTYLHRVYKNQLKTESDEKLGDIMCMLEKLSYPSLVASHIKPFIQSNKKEAYDPNNGLLLSRNIDILFDQGYISFDNNGIIIFSSYLNGNVCEFLKTYELDSIFLNSDRLKYLDYHRKNIFRVN